MLQKLLILLPGVVALVVTVMMFIGLSMCLCRA